MNVIFDWITAGENSLPAALSGRVRRQSRNDEVVSDS